MKRGQFVGMSKALVRRETIAAYLFLLPSLIFFVGFVLVPMAMALITSFFDYTMTDFSFTGLSNYKEMFSDPVFVKSMKNTIFLVVLAVPGVTVFSLWVASAIYKMQSGWRSFYRILFYLPVVTGTVAVTVVWKWMFNQYTGLFNVALKGAGLISKNINWLGSESYAIWCILLILFTTSVGQPIVLYVAALGNVDNSMLEAAEVDGASKIQSFWHIKWPAIMPTTLYILVITTINTFQCYALIQLLTSGGPNYSTSTVMYYIYYEAFKLYRYGYGNAMGVVLALIIAVFSYVQFRVTGDGKTE